MDNSGAAMDEGDLWGVVGMHTADAGVPMMNPENASAITRPN